MIVYYIFVKQKFIIKKFFEKIILLDTKIRFMYIHISFIIIVHNNLFFTKSGKSEFFFRKLNLYLVTLFNDSLLYKLIQFAMFLFEIALKDFALTQFLISLLLSLGF